MTVSFMSSKVLQDGGARLDVRGGIGLPDIFGATLQLLEMKKYLVVH